MPAPGMGIAAYWGGNMAAPLRILTVDDEPAVAFSLRYVFAGPRYEVLSVEDGYTALAKLDDPSEHYDAIIVDQKMPTNISAIYLDVGRAFFDRHY